MVRFQERHSHDSVPVVYKKEGGRLLPSSSAAQPAGLAGRGLIGILRQVLLPEGYPDSVSKDYLEIWDTVQAFASSITGSLATAAVLRGVGVGDSEATPLAATLTWILKDGAGMVGRIVFAAYSGTSLDHDCKRWRMFADVLNDCVMLLELLAPSLPVPVMGSLCLAGVGRSLVGVAGGASKAAVAQHQAKRNNMADLSAKDGSQETLVNLLALFVNLLLLPLVTDSVILTTFLFILLTSLHIYSNYRAVSGLVFNTLNLSRLNSVLDHYLDHPGEVLGPDKANRLEPVLKSVPKGRTRVRLGISISTLVEQELELLESAMDQGNRVLVVERNREVLVVLSNKAAPREVYLAYMQGYLGFEEEKCEELMVLMEGEGWDTSTLALWTEGYLMDMDKEL